MTDHVPLNGEELDAIRRRVEGWREGGYVVPCDMPSELHAEIMIRTAGEVLRHAPGDLARCVAEIERRRAEFDRLRNEAARIILLAEEQPCADGHTSCVKCTRPLLDELRSLLS